VSSEKGAMLPGEWQLSQRAAKMGGVLVVGQDRRRLHRRIGRRRVLRRAADEHEAGDDKGEQTTHDGAVMQPQCRRQVRAITHPTDGTEPARLSDR
jgi:hypothetical protein